MSSRKNRPSRGGPASSKRPKKRPRPQQQPSDSYYIHHTDRDMLLLIPTNRDLDESVCVRRRYRVPGTPEDTTTTVTTDYGWGSIIPPEVLHRIFRILTDSDGAVPILCRLSLVCQLWRQVACSPDLWRRVVISRCWVIPGSKDTPRTLSRVTKTIQEVIQHRLSQVSDFSLHHWKSHVPCVLEKMSSCCPQLSSLTLSHCSQVTVDALLSLGLRCPRLTSLNLQNSKVQPPAVQKYLELCGAKVTKLYLSYSPQLHSIMGAIARGSCPELRVLEIDLPLKSTFMDIQVPIEALQASCPKLEVLRLLNLTWQAKAAPRSLPGGPGFLELQELCLATTHYSSVKDDVCLRLLKDSRKLRVLDLRGCYRVSPQGLWELPCTDVVHLFLGLYSSTMSHSSVVSGSHLLTNKWRHSLQELDLTSQNFPEEDLTEALRNLAGGTTACNDTLRSLNLCATKATPHAVRDVLASCRALTHLDLTSCRNIPRGLKRVYRGREDVELCLADLTKKLQEAQEEEEVQEEQ